jgi:hypothetical protein
MPLVLPRDRWDAWLDPGLRDPDAVRALLQPPVTGRFLATAVTTRVNTVSNNGPQLLEPVPADQLRGVVDPATGELIGGVVARSSEPSAHAWTRACADSLVAVTDRVVEVHRQRTLS